MKVRLEEKFPAEVCTSWPQEPQSQLMEERLGAYGGLPHYGKLQEDGGLNRFWSCMRRGHWGLLEHGGATVLLDANRGVTHELVRHRLASYLQESTRYRNYGKDLVLRCSDPKLFRHRGKPQENPERAIHVLSIGLRAQDVYDKLLLAGWTHDHARGVLPIWTSASILITANWRQWLHILKLRLAKGVHPDMLAAMKNVKEVLVEEWPAFGVLLDQTNLEGV